MAATDTQPGQEYVETVRRVAEEAWGRGEFDVIEERVADDVVVHNTGAPEDVRGTEAYEALIGTYRTAMPDLEVHIVETVAEGDRVAMRFTTKGTHDGELMGIEPTGTEVEGEGLAIAHFDDGEVVEVWEYPDQLDLLQQLGVVELPG